MARLQSCSCTAHVPHVPERGRGEGDVEGCMRTGMREEEFSKERERGGMWGKISGGRGVG